MNRELTMLSKNPYPLQKYYLKGVITPYKTNSYKISIGLRHELNVFFLSRLDGVIEPNGSVSKNWPIHRLWVEVDKTNKAYVPISGKKAIRGPHKNVFVASVSSDEQGKYAYIPKDLDYSSIPSLVKTLMNEWNIYVNNRESMDYNPTIEFQKNLEEFINE